MKKTKKRRKQVWANCSEVGCEFKTCWKLGSEFCYVHTLVKYPLMMAEEIVCLNKQVVKLKND